MVRQCVCVADPTFGDFGGGPGIIRVALEGVFGLLVWDFSDSNFGAVYDFNGVTFRGTSENTTATSIFEGNLTIPEPGTLLLLSLGLLGIGLTRRPL
jgi:hypothetical protein